MKKLVLFIFVGILLISLVSALPYSFNSQTNLGTFKQGNCVDLIQTCGDCTGINITSIIYPNSTQSLGITSMSQVGTLYDYSYCDTNTLGTYIVTGSGNPNGTITPFVYNFLITENGQPAPTEWITIIFIASFLFIFIWLLVTLVGSLTHLGKLDLDIIDLMWAVAAYLSVWFYYYFATIFFPNTQVLKFTTIILQFGGITHLFIPILAFILSFTIGGLIKHGKD